MLFVSDIVDYMSDGVTHIVTESKWDDNFDEVCFLQCFVDCYCTVTHTWSGIHCVLVNFTMMEMYCTCT